MFLEDIFTSLLLWKIFLNFCDLFLIFSCRSVCFSVFLVVFVAFNEARSDIRSENFLTKFVFELESSCVVLMYSV